MTRKRKKADSPAGEEPPPSRKARHDLILRVERVSITDLDDAVALSVAKVLKAPMSDVLDCLATLRYRRQEQSKRFRSGSGPKRPKLDPDVMLKVRRVFERVNLARESDFSGIDDVRAYLNYLTRSGFLGRDDSGAYFVVPRDRSPSPSFLRSSRRRDFGGNGTCPWCGRPTRRHSRSKVHDPERCRTIMIENIMSD